MTGVGRIGSVALLGNTLNDVTKLQSELGELQQQISSGVKAKTFEQLNGQVEQFTLLEARIRRTEAYSDSNAIATARLQTADQALAQIVDVADDMENLIVAARNMATRDALPFKQQMNDLLKAMQSGMNINFDGRYLFSGSATNQIPVPDTTVRPNTTGVPDAGYYKGASTNLVVRVDENVQFDFPVRADDLAFQKIYAAAHQALRAYESGEDTEMKKALDLMQAGQSDLNGVRSKVNMAVVNVAAITDRLDSLNLYWKGVTEKVGKTDIVAATTKIASYEAVLQATFQVYARLSQLRLSDYLK